MIPKECKRLAEVDFPIALVSKHSAREKSIRHGHPSTLHLWWARRPLAACRAMLMALLLPDPCDENCPEAFRTAAREILLKKHGRPKRWALELTTPEGMRKTFLEFIGDLANWDNSTNMDYLDAARALVKAAHPEEPPLVVDPFAGGGSIPLEALRLGCEAFASDLNPVACLIQKVMLEDIPRHGPGLADKLRRVGKEIKEQAEKDLAEFYPKDPDGATPIAYLWARTVRCESPDCGAEIPLMRSFWLCKKASRKRALRYKVIRPKGQPPCIEFEIFEPTTDKEVHGGTVIRAKATCLCCGNVLPPERVRAQLSEQRGGADVVFSNNGKRIGGAWLLTVVLLHEGFQGRKYRLPTDDDYRAIWKGHGFLNEFLKKWEQNGRKEIFPIPNETTPTGGGSGAGRAFAFRKYGQKRFGDLFTSRQKASLLYIAKIIKHLKKNRIASMGLGKLIDLANANCRWEPNAECPRNVFAAGRVKPAWDFAEGVPTSESSGSLLVCFENLAGGIISVETFSQPATCQLSAAQETTLPEESTDIWFTDPPYYDAYPYADLSDVFYVWLKRVIPAIEIKKIDGPRQVLTPKKMEIVQDESRQFDGKPKNKAFFEHQMSISFKKGHAILKKNGIGCIVFAHKTTEGWESLISGIINGGLVVVASWPIATEQAHRLRAKESAALGTSVHLVCRPRPEDAPVGDWADILRELPGRVGDWMERLQGESIRGADLVFACIGPALEIFSRYKKVETAEGNEVKLAEYLEKVWEVVGRTALEQILGTEEARARNGMAGVLEEDARLTALFLWTLQATNGQKGSGSKPAGKPDNEKPGPKGKAKGYSLAFDVARRFAQPLGIDLPKWESRIIETKKGVVRLMAVSERNKQIFGTEGFDSAVEELISTSPDVQMRLPGFETLAANRTVKRRGRGQKIRIDDPADMDASATTLDRVHAAMLLQAGGQANALRMLIQAEQDRGPDFLRLANALSALYPKGSEEKRLLDAMLLAVPR